MIIKVCIGSACHVKGSYDVIETIKGIISKDGLEDKVQLKACFCLNKCLEGVSVSVEGVDETLQLTKENTSSVIKELLVGAGL